MNLYETAAPPMLNELYSNYTTGHEAKFGQPHAVKTILVPYWIQQVLARNKMNYIDLLDYDKVRKVMSAEDIASLLVFELGAASNAKLSQRSLLKQLFTTDSGLFDVWNFNPKSPENEKEFTNVIQPLSHSQDLANNVVERLCFDEAVEFDANSYGDLYRIQVNNDGTIFIFIQKGLLSALEDRSFAFKMASDYLQALYGLLTIPEVSARSIFRLYFSLI
jgi:hypothetical protein